VSLSGKRDGSFPQGLQGNKMRLSVILLQLANGMLTSVWIFILTLLFSLPLGLLVSLGRMSKNRIISDFVKVYIAIMRGTPLMLQLIVVYFAPYYLFRMNLTGFRFPAIIIAFSINYAAYFAEIYRGGIEAIPKEQYEAAEVLGYSKVQTFFRIILPQVIKIILPSLTNETITLVKDTSLAFVLAQAEMFTIAKQIAAKEASVGPLMIAGAFYFVFNFVVASVMERIEKKLDYY
jgi:His/Glu/Gln/Arg/opine family amino acid ABC transporter permease subunit